MGTGATKSRPTTNAHQYICAREATPIEASGGEMNGCTNGRWVMGAPYATSSKVDLPPTTVFWIYKQ